MKTYTFPHIKNFAIVIKVYSNRPNILSGWRVTIK